MIGPHLHIEDEHLSYIVPLADCPYEGLLLGRDSGCDVQLRSPGVARRHAAVRATAEGWIAENLGSRSELRIDDLVIRRATIPSGARLHLGSASALFHGSGDPCETGIALEHLPAPPTTRERSERSGRESTPLDALERLLTRLEPPAIDAPEPRWRLVTRLVDGIARELHLPWLVAYEENSESEAGPWRLCSVHDQRPRRNVARPEPRPRLLGQALTSRQLVWDPESRRRQFAFALGDAPAPRVILVGTDRGRDPPLEGEHEQLLDIAHALARQTYRGAQAVTRLEAEVSRVEEAARDNEWSVHLFQGGDVARKILERSRRAGAAGVPVVLLGPTGTGKELLASIIHRRSPRSREPFSRLECNLPPAAREKKLFGADGRLRTAPTGTVFFDGVHALPPREQLRILEQLPDEVVTIASTEVPLEDLLRAGLLIDPLARRLGDIVIQVPPLSERREEISHLVRHFLSLLAPHRPLKLASSALPLIENYEWPGNLRELKDVLERAVSEDGGNLIRPRDLPVHVRGRTPEEEEEEERAGEPESRRLVEVERRHVLGVLTDTGGCVTRAAKELGISRPRLYRMLERYGVGVEGVQEMRKRGGEED